MIRIFLILLIFFINNCSFNDKSEFWTKDKALVSSNAKIQNIFKNEEVKKDEFNLNFKIQTPLKISNSQNNSNRGSSVLSQNLNLKKISRYKFSKIDNFDYFDPTLVFYNTDLVFFDNKGSILRFDDSSKIIWKKNYYSKIEKKAFPILNFAIYKKTLIITDSISKYYALDLETGEKLWSKNHNTIFISDIKIDKDKFYVIDANNIIICFSLIDGTKIWEFKSESELIKSQKRLSIEVDKKNVYFYNSTGNLYSLDKKNGNLVWIATTNNTDNFFQSFLLKSSKLLLNNESLYISNNQNIFYSIDKSSGFINWTQNINSDIKPVIVGNLIFTFSTEGLFFVLDKNSGNILRITNIFKKFKLKKRKNIKPSGFLLDSKNIYLSLDNGFIVSIDIGNGKATSIYKISNDKISKPFFNENFMFIVKNNEIIKLK